MPPTLDDFSCPLIRKFCKLPGEIPSNFLTSLPFNQGFLSTLGASASSVLISDNNWTRNSSKSARVIKSISIRVTFSFSTIQIKYTKLPSTGLYDGT